MERLRAACGTRLKTSRPISRVLYGGRSRPRPRDGHSSRAAVTGRLEQPTRATARRRAEGLSAFGRPYSVLLPAGLAMPLASPRERCALTAPFHPCRTRRAAVCFLWRFPWGRPRRTLSGAVSPWSPDFPPREARGGHPAGWRHWDRRARTEGQWESARGGRFLPGEAFCLAP